MTDLRWAAATWQGSATRVHREQGTFRCASVLKPLYAWVTPEADPTDVEHAIVTSANAATDRIVEAAGGVTALIGRLATRTGLNLPAAPTWGRVPVTAAQVAHMYTLMQADHGATRLLDHMRASATLQRFNIDRRWAEHTGQRLDTLAVKTGWDLNPDEPSVRTHAVVLGPDTSLVLLTAHPIDPADRDTWNRLVKAQGPSAVHGMHRDWLDQPWSEFMNMTGRLV